MIARFTTFALAGIGCGYGERLNGMLSTGRLAMDYRAVSAWAAVVAALTAIFAVMRESRRSRFQSGVDILFKLNDMFSTEGMRKTRRKAAKGIRQGRNADVDDVLDFFEVVGLLVRRRAIADLFVWHSFFYWTHRYYLLTKEYVASVREKDPTTWSDFVWLHQRLENVEKRRRKCSDEHVVVDKTELDEFLKEEMQV